MDPQNQPPADQNPQQPPSTNPPEDLNKQYQEILDKYAQELSQVSETSSVTQSEPLVSPNLPQTSSPETQTLPQVQAAPPLENSSESPLADLSSPPTGQASDPLDELLAQVETSKDDSSSPLEIPPQPQADQASTFVTDTLLQQPPVSPPVDNPTPLSDSTLESPLPPLTNPVVNNPPPSLDQNDFLPPPAPVVSNPPSSFEPDPSPLAPLINLPPQAPEVKSTGGIFKILFVISLLVFVAVSGILAYSFVQKQNNGDSLAPLTQEPSPTLSADDSVSADDQCQLNDKLYAVGETFSAADNCNTCSCQPDLTIACTEKDCSSLEDNIQTDDVTE